MKKIDNKKLVIIIISVLLVLLLIVIALNVIVPNKKLDNTTNEEFKGVTNFEGEQVELEGHVEGDVDTVEEYQYMLTTAHYEKGTSFVYVSEDEKTITFNRIDNTTKEIIEIYVMNKETLETEVSFPEEDKNKDSK